MSNFEELLDIRLDADKYEIARITLDYMRRMRMNPPEWAIRIDAERRRKAAEADEANQVKKVRNRRKRSE